jgi:hypothetical protein
VSKPAPPTEAVPKNAEDVCALAGRVEQGDKTALPALRELLKDPEVVDRFGGDLAVRVQQRFIARFLGKDDKPNPLVQETLTRKLALLRGELAGPSPAPLERLLVERVVTCWLHLQYLELTHAGQDRMSLAQMTCWQRCLDSAQKRYLSAIKTLALVRKLALPVLQANIVRKQGNVAGPPLNGDGATAAGARNGRGH